MNYPKGAIFEKRVLKIIPVFSLIGLGVGIIGGYLYFYFIGCNSGSCTITSNPYMSTLWGAVLGYLLFDLFVPSGKKKKEE